jgi:RNA polymerase sigma factor (sigma-70 family)
MEDGQIIDLFWDRNEQAIHETQTKYQGLFLQIARNITGSLRDAEECVNDAFLRLWQAIPPAKPASLKNYAARIVRNRAIDQYRKNAVQPPTSELPAIFAELGETVSDWTGDDPSDFAVLVNDFLTTLDPVTRILFVRRYWLSESVLALAVFTELKPSAVKMRLARARNKLRLYLKAGGICS